jgi:hypothetical protein
VDTTYDARSKRIFFAMVDGSDPEIGHIYFDEHRNSLAMLSGSGTASSSSKPRKRMKEKPATPAP